MEYCIILCTTADKESAKEIAQSLIKDKLIACCNIVSNITSIYNWENKINEDNEFLLIMKTRIDLFDKINIKIKAIHNYEIPEIICIPIRKGNNDYLNWIDKETMD